MRYLRPPDFFFTFKINNDKFCGVLFLNFAKPFVCVCVCVFPRDRQMTQFLLGLQLVFLRNLKNAQLFSFSEIIQRWRAHLENEGRAFCGSSYGSAPS